MASVRLLPRLLLTFIAGAGAPGAVAQHTTSNGAIREIARIEHPQAQAWLKWAGPTTLLSADLNGDIALYRIEATTCDTESPLAAVARISALPGVRFAAARDNLAVCFDRSAVIGIRLGGDNAGEAWRELGGDIWLPRFGDQDPEFLARVQAATVMRERVVMFVNDGHAAALRLIDGKPIWAQRLSQRSIAGLYACERGSDESELIIVRQGDGLAQIDTLAFTDSGVDWAAGVLLEGTPVRTEQVGRNLLIICPDRVILRDRSNVRVLMEGAFRGAAIAATPGPNPDDPPFIWFADEGSLNLRTPAGARFEAPMPGIERLVAANGRVVAITADSLAVFETPTLESPPAAPQPAATARPLAFQRVPRPTGALTFAAMGDGIAIASTRQVDDHWETRFHRLRAGAAPPRLTALPRDDGAKSLRTAAEPMIEFQTDASGALVALHSMTPDGDNSLWFTALLRIAPE